MKTQTLTFNFEKETKGAVRFSEQTQGELTEPVVGTLYIRKSGLSKMGLDRIPNVVKVTLEVEG
jgi:hypothetical protein